VCGTWENWSFIARGLGFNWSLSNNLAHMRENMKLKTEKNNLWAQTWNNFVRSFTYSTIVVDIIDHLPWIYSSFFGSDWTYLLLLLVTSQIVFRSKIDRKKRNFFYRHYHWEIISHCLNVMIEVFLLQSVTSKI